MSRRGGRLPGHSGEGATRAYKLTEKRGRASLRFPERKDRTQNEITFAREWAMQNAKSIIANRIGSSLSIFDVFSFSLFGRNRSGFFLFLSYLFSLVSSLFISYSCLKFCKEIKKTGQ